MIFAILYGGGYLAQFIQNYSLWKNSGSVLGDGTSPVMPSFNVIKCFKAMFCFPYGIFGLLICIGLLALLLIMVMRMGYSDTGEYDKDRNLTYSNKGTYYPNFRKHFSTDNFVY